MREQRMKQNTVVKHRVSGLFTEQQKFHSYLVMLQHQLHLSSILYKSIVLESLEIQKSSNIYKYRRTEEDVSSGFRFADLCSGYSSLLNKIFFQHAAQRDISVNHTLDSIFPLRVIFVSLLNLFQQHCVRCSIC